MSLEAHTTPETGDDVSGFAHVPRHVWEFAQDQQNLANAARDIRRYLEELAEAASIDIHTIEARPKSLASYQEKALAKRPDGSQKYVDPATQIHDSVAARVIVFTTRARNDLADLISLHTEVKERQNPGDHKHNGYDSEHLVISALKNPTERTRHIALSRYLDRYRGLEIQIRSVAGHAWAEYEHDIRYKSPAYQELSEDGKRQIDQWFVEAGGMRRVMDELFGKIEDRLVTVTETGDEVLNSDQLSEDTAADFEDELDPRPLTEETLTLLITERFPNQNLGDHLSVKQLLEHIHTLDVITVGQLGLALANVEEGQVARLMDYPGETTGVRRLDDELLATFTEQYVETATGDDRKQFLRLRLRRVLGKFAIYSVDEGNGSRRLRTAARAVRDIAKAVATEKGLQSATVPGAVATDKADLNASTNARPVQTGMGTIYVATNFSRAWAEDVMGELVDRMHGSPLRVYRAGDLLFEAPGDDDSSAMTL